MVSLRRRRNPGLPPLWFDHEAVGHYGPPPPDRIILPPIVLTDEEKKLWLKYNPPQHQNDQTNGDGSNSSKQESDQPSPVQQAKFRTPDRKITVHEKELSSVKGVYMKNMKWQAAIKVNNKQIHLGTLETPEEAARIYDRAAFVIGRVPNFELPEEDKEELRELKWDQFLEKTKHGLRKRKPREEAAAPENKSPQAKKHCVNEAKEAVVEIASFSEVAELK